MAALVFARLSQERDTLRAENERLKAALASKTNHIRHGMNCKRVEHIGGGYLHAAADDSPYDVDGVMYCGRCHVALEIEVKST